MKCIRFSCCILIAFSFIFALEPARVSLDPLPKLRGDEIISQSDPPIPCLGGRQSPGVQIGITTYDYQANGSYGQRLSVKDNNQVHVDWMWCGGAYPGTPRYCAWNFRFTDGTWHGETQAAPSVSGYCQLDVTREVIPDSQRTVICYHHDAGAGYYSWIDIEPFGNPVSPAVNDHLWPYVCWSENGNIVMATGDYNVDLHHLYYSLDMGANWIFITTFDSVGTLSQFLRSSRNSNKVVFVHTQWITNQPNITLDNDVYYLLSTDGGVTWGPHTNMTNYQTLDTVRAFNNVNAVFDMNDNLHIAWTGARCHYPDFWIASKIFHWDEVNDTITVVSSPSIYYVDPGGWWIATTTSSDPGAWSRPADQPQLVVDTANNDLYCLWHGNDDYNDGSAAGFFNGELYGAKSTDGGVTWTDYTNLTNTRTPGAPSGACDDEDYMTANPFILNDSIYVAYIEDKDAGSMPHTEGVMTTNPVRCWVFHKDLIPGIKEKISLEVGHTTPILEIYPNPFRDKAQIRYMIHDTRYMMNDYSLRIFDAAGQLVKDFSRSTLHALRPTLFSWDGTDQANKKLPDGVYFLEFETSDYTETKKLILLR